MKNIEPMFIPDASEFGLPPEFEKENPIEEQLFQLNGEEDPDEQNK